MLTPQRKAVLDPLHRICYSLSPRILQVKNKWGKKLFKASKFPDYVDMRYRMLSRKRAKSAKKVERKPGYSQLRVEVLTIADIIAALETGEE
ncbi:hypothetical protein C0991_002702 [Blastosporella zonata]|nr:hypothetical protein C0991_002702 [Blastosporella zonata]